MKIAIIGATGMIGHHTAKAVLERGHNLLVIHRASSNLSLLKGLKLDSAIADLDNINSLTTILSNVDAVINCAAYYPTKPLPWKQEVETAVSQMEKFLSACKQAKVAKIVYLGAAIALPKDLNGNPGNEELIYKQRPSDKTPYVQVKWEMDRIAREMAKEGLPIVIAIPSMCFGEYDYAPSTGRLVVEVANNTLPAYIKGKRNVIYAGDAGAGIVLACEKGRVGERYLFTGTNISMDELIQLIAKIANTTAPTKVIPLSIAKLISKLQETKYKLLGGELPKLSSTAIAVMASGQFLDGSKAASELGFKPTLNLEQTIERTINWFKANGYITSEN
jgi:dihydroflavonol-4-reductase